jgi:hypothetical protein
MPLGAELLLLNPRRRRRRKMTAKQRKYFGGNPRRGRKRRKGRGGASAITARGSGGGTALTIKSNPRRRRRHYSANPRRRYRRNPAFRMPTGQAVMRQLTDAATGAAGATLIDIGMGFIAPRLPAQMLTPTIYPIVKSGAAILAGTVGASMGGQAGRLLVKGAEGSLICTLRDVIRAYLPANIALGYINSGYIPARGMGAYLRGVNTPLMGVNSPLMGMGEGEGESEYAPWSPPYPGLRGVGAYLNR